MGLNFTIPGKTFFVGEYSALNGGPVITVATAPRFEMRVRPGSGWLNGIHKDSPAGHLVSAQAAFFNQFDLEFIDPHLGRGGWGASTAQFLACYALLQWQETAVQDGEKFFDTHKMLKTYKEMAWSGEGLPPSGADLVGQLKGGLTFFENRRGAIVQLNWPFDDLEFYLVSTGQKISTHEHLQGLKSFDSEKLEVHVRQVQEGLVNGDPMALIEGVNRISRELDDKNWIHPKSKELLQKFAARPGVLATKGCGALGADVVLVIVEKSKSVLFEAMLKGEGHPYFTRHHISKGLDFTSDGEMKVDRYSTEFMP